MTTTRPRRTGRGGITRYSSLWWPNLALLLLFVYRPLVDNIRLSFFDWNISDPTAEFVGSPTTSSGSVVRTPARSWPHGDFTTAAVAGSMVLGLLLAMLLDQPLRGRNLVRSTVFAPFVISGAAAVWQPSSCSIHISVWCKTCCTGSGSTLPTSTRTRPGRCSW
ncbi:SN-glycerol-3-phosphate transport integral membrane ABC transporter UgpA domain protein [Mycobacterium ulcerans str. Harvey]|uniref:SN-glycerol-3-phosphate transport integral membrane ABC transporter UgpA domain protein n=1 Tax=Mycobacterium ulcerans str. Harvey TaxID=1299332 RepID=A0ABP3AT25_MYCUL|nr:SN-glycerol-3-phosphate transport integral membrane ABC transporter UgpA domain protein [Mycobacterium ulcerans str. Harvey]